MKDTDVMAKWMESIERRLDSINTLQSELLNTVIERTDCLASKDSVGKIDGRLTEVEKFQTKQKAYLAAAVFIGGIIVGIVNWILDNYDRLKNK